MDDTYRIEQDGVRVYACCRRCGNRLLERCREGGQWMIRVRGMIIPAAAGPPDREALSIVKGRCWRKRNTCNQWHEIPLRPLLPEGANGLVRLEPHRSENRRDVEVTYGAFPIA